MRYKGYEGQNYQTPVDVWSDNNTRKQVFTRKRVQGKESGEAGVVQDKRDGQSLF